MPTVRDVMSTALLTVDSTENLTDAARPMHERGVGPARAPNAGGRAAMPT